MKDRSPKYPGRVKLTPVAGQTNIYDMTRADEPDDTGTPFNTRTMLQNSTAQFLKLPVSNPFVDDALRHMPDRIEPIGTVKTSSALSLGDAWLKCDGSQVTFSEYPALCQILRKTVSSPTWSTITLCSDLALMHNSGMVNFQGKWYVAISGLVGDGKNAVLRIYSTEAPQGIWTLAKTFSITVQNRDDGYPCALACSDELLIAAWTADTSGGGTTVKLYGTEDMDTWSNSTFNAVLYGWENVPGSSVELATDGAYWLMLNGANGELYGTTTPLTGSSWAKVTEPTYIQNERYMVSDAHISYLNGEFVVSRINGQVAYPGITVYSTKAPASAWTKIFDAKNKITGIGTSTSHRGGYISNVCFFSGRYYFAYAAYDGYSAPYYSRPLYLVSFANEDLWEQQKIEDPGSSKDVFPYCVAASDKMIALTFAVRAARTLPATLSYKLVTSGEPSGGFSDVTISGGSPISPTFIGDVAFAVGLGAIYYHDYSNDARLLPTISLSDDTTTFIKAKNELDVFESGGD